MELNEVDKIIIEQFPVLKISSIKKTGEGWHSQAFNINDDYVFRFPKIQEASDNLRKEICLLPKIESLLNLPIPHFEYVGKPSTKFDKYFVGYIKIKGSFLTGKLYNSLSKDVKEYIAKTLAEFLQLLHAIPIEIPKGCGLEEVDFRKDYEDDLRRMKSEVFLQLSQIEQKHVIKIFNGYLEDAKNFKYEGVLLHNDLSSDHLLFDEDQMELKGIIDWGDVVIGDPDYDLMYLYDDFGIDFIELFLKYYHHDDHTHLMKKLKFFNFCDSIHTILCGYSNKEQEKIDKGVTSLKRRISHGLGKLCG